MTIDNIDDVVSIDGLIGIDNKRFFCELNPYEKLALRMILQTYVDIRSSLDLSINALEWTIDDSNKPFSLQWLCDVLNLNIDYVKHLLLKNDGEKYYGLIPEFCNKRNCSNFTVNNSRYCEKHK